MSNSISGIPTTRVSTQLARTQLLNNLNSSQLTMVGLENQISSGHQYQLPSESADAALQVMGIQSLLQRKPGLPGYWLQSLRSKTGLEVVVANCAVGFFT